jgi:hypothetical protein
METYGFYGAYWKCKTGSDCAMIAMIGDDSEDYLARTSVKWLHKLGVNVMTMSPGKKDYGHHNYPLERIEKAISSLILAFCFFVSFALAYKVCTIVSGTPVTFTFSFMYFPASISIHCRLC